MTFSEGDTKREVVFGIHMDVLKRNTQDSSKELFLSSKVKETPKEMLFLASIGTF